MPSQWYCNRDGKQLGPFTDQQLKQLAASGMLQLTDQVRRDGTAKWVSASRVKGLFPAGEPSQKQPAARQATTQPQQDEIPTVLPVEPANPFDFDASPGIAAAPETQTEPQPESEGEILNNYPASVGTDLSNPLDRLGILLAVLWGLGTLAGLFLRVVTEEEMMMGLTIAIFIGGGIAMGIFVRYAANTQCPKCKQLWAKEYLGSRLVKQEGGYETVERHEFDRRPGREGHIKSSWLEQVHVVREVYIDCYRCGHCRHRWRGVSSQQYEG